MSEHRVGFTCGTFDLLHAGHVLMLKEAKTYCKYLIVGLQTDPTLDREEKNKPVQGLRERFVQLEAVRHVDEVVVYDTESHLLSLLGEILPDVRIIGEDWRGREFTGCGLSMIDVVYNTRDHTYSSSELRARIVESEVIRKVQR